MKMTPEEGPDFRDVLTNNEMKVTRLSGRGTFYNNSFLVECIQTMENLPMMMAAGHELTPLEKLAVSVLFDHYEYRTGIKL